MNKTVAADVFETLGGIAQGTGQQAATQVKKMGEDVLESLGAKPSAQTPTPGDSSQPNTPSPEQIQKMGQEAKVKAAAGLKKIQADIKVIEQKRKQELPKQVTGQPGFSEEKMVKQLEEKKAEEKKLPPVSVQREQTKAERSRGTVG